MKKFLFSIMLIAAAAAALISCGKSPELENKSDNPEVTTIKLVANAFTPETKTVIENDYSVSWEETGEEVKLIELKNGNIRETYVNTGYNRVDAKNAEFTFDLFEDTDAADFDYYAVYPFEVYQSVSAGEYGDNDIVFYLPEVQTPPSGSPVDPAASILLASNENLAAQPASLDFSFKHLAAYGRMTLKGVKTLIGAETLESITIYAAGKAVSGGMHYYFAPNANNGNKPAGTMEPKPDAKKSYVVIDADNIAVSTEFDVWFACLPFNIAGGETLQVSVSTDTKTYTKTITIPASKSLSFIKGEVSLFTVNMSDGTVAENDLSGRYVIVAKDPAQSSNPNAYEALNKEAKGTKLNSESVTVSGTFITSNANIVWTLMKNGAFYTINDTDFYFLAWDKALGGDNAKTGYDSCNFTITKVPGQDYYRIASTDTPSRILARDDVNKDFAFYEGTQNNNLYLFPAIMPEIIGVSPESLTWTQEEGTESKTITVYTNDSQDIFVTKDADAEANFNVTVTDADATDGIATITVAPKAAAGATARKGTISIYACHGTGQSAPVTVNLAQPGKWTHTFASGQLNSSPATLSGKTWTYTATWDPYNPTPYFSFNTTKGIQIGSFTNTCQAFTLSSTDFTGTITKIVVNSSIPDKGNAKFKVYVNNVQWGAEISLTTTATDYTFTGSGSGEIKISYTNTAYKEFFIKSLSVMTE
jgi:hypothetical protein